MTAIVMILIYNDKFSASAVNDQLPRLSRSIEPESPVSRWHQALIVQLDPHSAVEH